MANTIELKEFGSNLKRERKSQKLTLNELADLAEMDSKQIGRIEKGEINLTFTTIMKLLMALNIDANSLFPKR